MTELQNFVKIFSNLMSSKFLNKCANLFVTVASPPEKCGLETKKVTLSERHKCGQTASSTGHNEPSNKNTHNGQLSSKYLSYVGRKMFIKINFLKINKKNFTKL